MKIIGILFFFCVLSSGSYAQKMWLDILPLKDNKICYTGVVQVDSVLADELYQRAKEWMVRECDVIKINNKNELAGNGFYYNVFNKKIWYLIQIKIKDNHYKYELTDFKEKSSEFKDAPLEDTKIIAGKNEYYRRVDEEINEIITGLKKAMQTPIDDKW